MPGLFGILHLGPKSFSIQEQEIAFTKMAASLRHHEEDQVEHAYIFDLNLMIGRVGLPGRHKFGWSSGPHDEKAGIDVFVSGPLLEREDNGPLYNMPDNTKLRRWGGFFSAVLADPVRGATLLVVDHKASSPIFYTHTKDQLLFAPEVKALLTNPLVTREIDLEAISTFLAQGYLLSDQTLFRSVKRLRGGELLRVENGRVVKEAYWRFAPGSASGSASEAELEHELGQLLNAAAQKHLGNPEKTVIFLSGGVDSRGILGGALASVHDDGRKLNTVSWGASQGTDDSDVSVAASIARTMNTNHRFMQRKISEFRQHFTRANYLIDCLSDIPAFHPYEYQLMIELRNSGYERVLRGDEVFGWSLSASTNEGAFAIANLRRLRDVHGMGAVIQAGRYDELRDASDAAVERALFEARDLPPNQAKDFYYFTHRLQCYLQTGSYYKQIELDQRNVLLDDPILDFMAKVPDWLRIDKKLFRRVVDRQYSDLVRFPFAKRPNFEDWIMLLATESPVREYAMMELTDLSSGIWEFLDPGALTSMLEGLSRGYGIQSMLNSFLDPKALAKRTLTIFVPGLVSRIQSERRARPVVRLEADQIIMRALVLKNWYDTFT